MHSGSSSSSFDTGISASTSYSIFEVFCNASGTAVTFSINGTRVASSSVNVPTSSTGLGWSVHTQKSSGSQTRGIAIDWYSLSLIRESPR